jgi:hypothetical protein
VSTESDDQSEIGRTEAFARNLGRPVAKRVVKRSLKLTGVPEGVAEGLVAGSEAAFDAFQSGQTVRDAASSGLSSGIEGATSGNSISSRVIRAATDRPEVQSAISRVTAPSGASTENEPVIIECQGCGHEFMSSVSQCEMCERPVVATGTWGVDHNFSLTVGNVNVNFGNITKRLSQRKGPVQ